MNRPQPIPERILIDARAQIGPAIQRLLQHAVHTVRCCSHDGAAFDLGSPPVVKALGALLRSRRGARVLLLVDDPGWIEAQAPRLKGLHRQWSHALHLRRASSEDPVGSDLHLIADELHCLRLQVAHLVSGELWLNSEPRTRPLVNDFDRRWETASHDLPVSPLGL